MPNISYLDYRKAKKTARRKYNNRRVEIDGIVFDSAFEAKVWSELNLKVRLGEISDLQRQVKIDLKVNNTSVCSIVMDFVYTDLSKNKTIYADAKSEATRANRAYRIKKKLFKALYGHDILEITKGKGVS